MTSSWRTALFAIYDIGCIILRRRRQRQRRGGLFLRRRQKQGGGEICGRHANVEWLLDPRSGVWSGPLPRWHRRNMTCSISVINVADVMTSVVTARNYSRDVSRCSSWLKLMLLVNENAINLSNAVPNIRARLLANLLSCQIRYLRSFTRVLETS